VTLLLKLGTRTWRAPQGRAFRLGRHEANDLVLSDGRISRFHAQISWDGEQPWLHDCGSSNGTLIDGLRLTGPVALQGGEILGLGPWDLTVEVRAAPALVREDEDALFSFPGETRHEELLGTWKSCPELHRLLLSLEEEERTGSVDFAIRDRTASLTFCLGRVVAAQYGRLQGVSAVDRILRTPQGRYLHKASFDLCDNTIDVSVRQHLRNGFFPVTRRHARAEAPPLPRRRRVA
jgi:hypothetical protein